MNFCLREDADNITQWTYLGILFATAVIRSFALTILIKNAKVIIGSSFSPIEEFGK